MKFDNLKSQFVSLIPAFLLIYIPSLAFFCALLLVHATTDVSMSVFLDDPLSYVSYPSYIGLASNVGILLWCASASVMIFAYLILRKKGFTGESVSFLLVFGLITALLGLDDLFMIHEAVGDGFVAAFGTSDDLGEGVAFGVYILLFVIFAIKYIKVILRTEYLLFISFIILCAINIIIDLAPFDFSREVACYVEEITKFLAIVNWFAYTTRTTYKFVKEPEF